MPYTPPGYLQSLLTSWNGSPVTQAMADQQNAQSFKSIVEQILLQSAVDYLLAAENKRCQNRMRKPKSTSISTNEKMLTKKDVAERLGVDDKSINRYVKKGELHCYKLGKNGQCRFKLEDVEKFLIQEQSTAQQDIDLDSFINRQTKKG
jgi:excisionase family DNA binding protein